MEGLKRVTKGDIDMKPFMNSETIINANMRQISFHDHDYIGGIKAGSYNVIQARLFGLSFPDYLRFVRDKYHATLVGKAGYTHFVFNNSADCDALVKELNRRWAIVKKERAKIES